MTANLRTATDLHKAYGPVPTPSPRRQRCEVPIASRAVSQDLQVLTTSRLPRNGTIPIRSCPYRQDQGVEGRASAQMPAVNLHPSLTSPMSTRIRHRRAVRPRHLEEVYMVRSRGRASILYCPTRKHFNQIKAQRTTFIATTILSLSRLAT